MYVKNLLEEFIGLIAEEQVEVYNEFSLQHEMGIFLRSKLKDFKIQFERNAKFFNIHNTIKHEIDIVIYNDIEKYAIELKYPVNGQYPEEMYAFIKDIKFMEQLKESGFNNTYALTLVEDSKFYSGKKQDGIYAYFRGVQEITGTIHKPTGQKQEEIHITGNYKINWSDCGKYKYYLISL